MESFRSSIIQKLPLSWQVPAYYYLQPLIGTREPEVQHLKEYVNPKKRAIDIGGNKGVYAYPLSRLSTVVEVFEPQPELVKLLSSFSSKVRVYGEALSDHHGEMELNIPYNGDQILSGLASLLPVVGQHKTIKVPVRMLDEYNFSDVGFIKIDVEGHERALLKGALQTIHQNRPNLLIEIEQRHLSYPMTEVIHDIEQLGYTGWFYLDNKLQSINVFNYEQHQWPMIEQVKQDKSAEVRKRYVNNFFFTPSSG